MEVSVKIRFTTPCLGDMRGPNLDQMRRGPDGRVCFMQSWWMATLKFAAHAISRHHKEVEQIQADPLIDGQTQRYKRYYSIESYKEHEAFLDGDEITVRFLLPNNLAIGAFKQLLEVAGQYAGISPYGFKQNYGRFVVVSVEPVRRSYVISPDQTQRKPNSDHPSDGIDPGTGPTVH